MKPGLWYVMMKKNKGGWSIDTTKYEKSGTNRHIANVNIKM